MVTTVRVVVLVDDLGSSCQGRLNAVTSVGDDGDGVGDIAVFAVSRARIS